MTRKEIEDPTEVEIELKRRLGQLTDHLIQKQAQVFPLNFLPGRTTISSNEDAQLGFFSHGWDYRNIQSFHNNITPFHGKNGNFLLKYCTNKRMKTRSRSPKPFSVKL